MPFVSAHSEFTFILNIFVLPGAREDISLLPYSLLVSFALKSFKVAESVLLPSFVTSTIIYGYAPESHISVLITKSLLPTFIFWELLSVVFSNTISGSTAMTAPVDAGSADSTPSVDAGLSETRFPSGVASTIGIESTTHAEIVHSPYAALSRPDIFKTISFSSPGFMSTV